MIFNKKSPLKICVITGGRAEYGLLKGVMGELRDDEECRLQIVVTGMHLSAEQGMTWRQIESDGFVIDEKVDIDLSDDSALGIARSTARAVDGIAAALHRLRPNACVVLGDRYEILAAATAAHLLRIPIAHLHGGEITEGALDDSIRHAITKLAHWHFVAAEPYRARVIQMGESPDRVWNVGALGADALAEHVPMTNGDFEKKFGFRFDSPSFLITYHPATLDLTDIESQCEEFLKALDAFPDASLLFTKANADEGGRRTNEKFEAYVVARKAAGKKAEIRSALGSEGYLSAIALCDLVLGNSSSGIIEAPFFGKPTVNIGIRQQGRLMADSILSCGTSASEITEAIRRVLGSEFVRRARETTPVYGKGGAAKKIREKLKESFRTKSPAELLRKKFHDLKGSAIEQA